MSIFSLLFLLVAQSHTVMRHIILPFSSVLGLFQFILWYLTFSLFFQKLFHSKTVNGSYLDLQGYHLHGSVFELLLLLNYSSHASWSLMLVCCSVLHFSHFFCLCCGELSGIYPFASIHYIFYQELLKEKSNPRLKGNRKGIIVKGKEFYIPILNTFPTR